MTLLLLLFECDVLIESIVYLVFYCNNRLKIIDIDFNPLFYLILVFSTAQINIGTMSNTKRLVRITNNTYIF